LNVTSLGAFVLFAVSVGALRAAVTSRRRDTPKDCSGLAPGIALLFALAAILAVTLVPDRGPHDRHLVPLVHTISELRSPTTADAVLNLGGNVLLFLPLGAALCVLGLRTRTTVLIGLCLSALIEIAQLHISGRTTSVDDVVFNCLGTLMGSALTRRTLAAKVVRRAS
jgi:glycopeptide antibiotics resistance protein